MIRCDICGEYFYPEEMWIVGPFPLFTYLDSQICNGCFDPLLRFIEGCKTRIEFEEPIDGSIYFSNYSEMRDDLCKAGVKNDWIWERECPICEGIMGEGFNEEWDCFSLICLNCGHEVIHLEVELKMHGVI